jgi:hypothetical protein
MKMRRLVPLGVAATLLLAVAGIASHGRPLSGGGRGRGPSASFFDYVSTTLVLLGIVMVGVLVYALWGQRVSGTPQRGRWYLLSTLTMFIGSFALAYFLLRTGFVERLRHLEHSLASQQQPHSATQRLPTQSGKHVRNARLRWDEILVFLVLVLGTAVVLYAGRKTRRTPRPWRLLRNEEVSQAIDESIDDLRTDPDLRRAIVAAYARMERALGRAGLPRHPSEAPFEYVGRALRSLDTSADSARRLTTLFERAKFSQHEPEPQMRDEAIDALLAVRDELARPVEEPVAS